MVAKRNLAALGPLLLSGRCSGGWLFKSINVPFELEHDSEIIAARTGIHYEQVQEIMGYMVESGLFEKEGGVITCQKMATRTDE